MRLLALALLFLVTPAMAAHPAPMRTVVSGDWTIRWNDGVAKAQGPTGKTLTLYERTPPDEGCTEELTGKVLAVVGSLISYKTVGSGYCEGAMHPWAVEKFSTVDLSKGGAPVRLDSLVTEPQLIAALLSDKCGRRIRALK